MNETHAPLSTPLNEHKLRNTTLRPWNVIQTWEPDEANLRSTWENSKKLFLVLHGEWDMSSEKVLSELNKKYTRTGTWQIIENPMRAKSLEYTWGTLKVTFGTRADNGNGEHNGKISFYYGGYGTTPRDQAVTFWASLSTRHVRLLKGQSGSTLMGISLIHMTGFAYCTLPAVREGSSHVTRYQVTPRSVLKGWSGPRYFTLCLSRWRSPFGRLL